MSDLTTVDLYKLEKYEIEKDPHILARNGYLTIKIKDPGPGQTSLAKFRPKPIQQRYYDFIDEIRKNNEPIRIWVVKPRQIGLTTATEALIYARTSQTKGINSFIISNDAKGSDYIFNMAKLHQEFLEKDFPHLAPKIKRTNKIELSFSDIHSTIFIDTAKNIVAGQKYTVQNLHLSEIALFDNAEELMDGLMPAIPKHPGTMVVGECSAQGVGNFFHRECMRSYNKESTWKLFFPSYLEELDYKKAINENQLRFLEKTLTPEENKIIEIYNATPEQIWWRRFILIDEFRARNLGDDNYDLLLPDPTSRYAFDKFRQFYPTNVLEAFISTGRSVFDKSVLQEWMSGVPRIRREGEDLELGKTYIKGEFEIDAKSNISFIEGNDGFWFIFDFPKIGIDYVMGADVAEGIEIEDGSREYDYSAIQIFRLDTLEQVAEFKGHIEPDLFAKECFYACKSYNNCVAGIESNKDGNFVIHTLRDKYGYNNIYVRDVIEEERSKRRTKKLGFLTTSKSKPMIIGNMAEAIREKGCRFYSERLINEGLTYIRTPDGKTCADSQCFDDLVMSCAIALFLSVKVPRTEAWQERKRLQISYRR